MENLFVAEPIIMSLFRFARQRGVTDMDMLDSLGFDLEKTISGKTKTEPLPFQPYAKAYEFIERKTGDKELGLHLGEQYNIAALGVVGQLITLSQNIGESLEKACQHFKLISNALELEIRNLKNSFQLVFNVDKDCLNQTPIAAKHLLCSSMVFAFNEIQFLTHRRVRPLIVQNIFSTDVPDEYERVFKQKVKFKAEENIIEFHNSLMDQKVIYADYELLMILEKEACRRLASMKPASSLKDQIESLIYTLLNPALPSFDDIASNLNMSDRTLQRKLMDEGTSYSKIIEGIKKDLAIAYLKQDISIKEVSYLMGYSEPASFINAFKKWFGRAPLSYKSKFLQT